MYVQQTASTQLNPNILLVEDDPEIASMLTGMLTDSGFSVSAAVSGCEMDRALARGEADVIILDVMLPGEDGLSICRRVRAISQVPIIFLTALGQDVDRIIGLEIGADDYVTKPFNSRELVARIRALLRRSRGIRGSGAPRPSAMRFAGWALDPAARQLLDPAGVRITLTSAEFDLLLAFCRNPARILTREELLELTHGGAAGPVERSIDVHVSRVRQKIEPDPKEPSLIKTVRLGGYIFTPAVETVS